jgi:two-component system nitrate/nitrite response regulator NarL
MPDLTPRQREVALLAHKSNLEIGKALGISANTVKIHMADVFLKLGVNHRSEVVERVEKGELK